MWLTAYPAVRGVPRVAHDLSLSEVYILWGRRFFRTEICILWCLQPPPPRDVGSIGVYGSTHNMMCG